MTFQNRRMSLKYRVNSSHRCLVIQKNEITKGKPINFAQVTATSSKAAEVDNSGLVKYQGLCKKSWENVILKLHADVLHTAKQRTLIYKIFNAKEKRIMAVSNEQVEKCLQPIWRETSYVGKCNRYVTVEVQFSSEEIVRKYSTEPLKSPEIVLLLTYLIWENGHRKWEWNKFPQTQM